MNIYIFKLLKILLNRPNTTLYKSNLAKLFQVSVRTIENYFNTLKELSSDYDFADSFVYLPEGIKYEGNEEITKQIFSLLSTSNFYNYKLSKEERTVLITLLFIVKDNIKINEIVDFLYVSRSTILNDIPSVKSYFALHSIILQKMGNKGYDICLTEDQKRELIIELIFDINNNKELEYIKFLIENLREDDIISNVYTYKINPIIISLLQSIEDKIKFTFNDQQLIIMRDIINIQLTRIKNNEKVRMGIVDLWNEVEHKDNLSLNMYINTLTEELRKYFSLEFSKDEQTFLLSMILKYQVLNWDASIVHQFSLEFGVKILVSSVASKLNINFLNIDQLEKAISNHIKTVSDDDNYSFIGSIHSLPTDHFDAEYYDYVFRIVKERIHLIESIVTRKLSIADIMLITMHFLSNIYKMNKKDPVNVIIVCRFGLAVSSYLSEKLSSIFNINVIAQSSLIRLESLDIIEEADLIISTVPLLEKNIPVVYISNELNESDIFNISNEISGIYNKKIHFQSSRHPLNAPIHLSADYEQFHFINRERIAIIDSVEDWESSMRLAGELLFDKDEIDKDYIQSMVDIIHDVGPYIVFVPGIALAHGPSRGEDIPLRLSILKLNHPVEFHSETNDPVWCVFALYYSHSKENQYIVEKLINAMAEPRFRERLLNSNTKEEIYHTLDSFIQLDYEASVI